MNIAWIAQGSLFLCIFSACQFQYKLPKPGEPQALVKVRRVYHDKAGTHLTEFASIEGAVAQSQTAEVALTATNAFPLAVHAKPVVWRMVTDFHHYETRACNETYQVSVPYQVSRTESYLCGSGRTCSRSVSVTEHRQETRNRIVNRTISVSDAACEVQFAMTPAVNHEYLLQHNFMGSQACSVSCFREQGRIDGEVTSTPCTAAEYIPLRAR